MVATRAAAAGWGGGPVSTRCTVGSQQNCYFWLADADSGPLAPRGGIFAHYPHIYFDRSGSCPDGQTGRCHLAMIAWTTTDQSCSAYGYYDIHYLISPDGGATWYGREGAIPYTSFPILAGDDGPAGSCWTQPNTTRVGTLAAMTPIGWPTSTSRMGTSSSSTGIKDQTLYTVA